MAVSGCPSQSRATRRSNATRDAIYHHPPNVLAGRADPPTPPLRQSQTHPTTRVSPQRSPIIGMAPARKFACLHKNRTTSASSWLLLLLQQPLNMRVPGLSFNDLPPSIYQSSQVVIQGYSSFVFNFKKHFVRAYHVISRRRSSAHPPVQHMEGLPYLTPTLRSNISSCHCRFTTFLLGNPSKRYGHASPRIPSRRSHRNQTLRRTPTDSLPSFVTT
jgi:hypothetical protein